MIKPSGRLICRLIITGICIILCFPATWNTYQCRAGNVVVWLSSTEKRVDMIRTTIPTGLSDVVALAAGTYHCLALRHDTTVVAWGDNTYGQCSVPTGLSNVVAIAAGLSESVALRSDGTLVGWGQTSSNDVVFVPFTIPSGLSNIVAVSQTLALKDNGAILDLSGLPVPAGVLDVMSIAGHIALRNDGTAISLNGQAVPPIGLNNLAAIAAGNNFCVARKSDNTVVAWGQSNWGQADVPAGLSDVAAIAAGDTHSLALKDDGTVVAWGGYFIGIGYPIMPVKVPAGLSNVVAIAAGRGFSVAYTDTTATSIVQPPSNATVYLGRTAVFSVSASGSLPMSYQWRFKGNNLPGATNFRLILPNAQLADVGEYSVLVSNSLGSVLSSNAVLKVMNGPPVIMVQPTNQAVYLGASATFYVIVDGSEPYSYQWRFNGLAIADATNDTLVLSRLNPAQAGDYDVVVTNPFGSAQSIAARLSFLPLVVWGGATPSGLSNIVAVAAGNIDIAIQSDGTVLRMGLPPSIFTTETNIVAVAIGGSHGQGLRGDGTVVEWRITGNPTYTGTPLSNVVAIAEGWQHSMALEADGTVVAWGYNDYGQSNVPPGLSNVVMIAAGTYHSLALKADGALVTWGSNQYGESAVPAGLSNVTAIAARGQFSLALKSDGTVIGWGNDAAGRATPPAGLSNVVAIAAGFSHSLALKSDGTVVAWGYTASGAANVPAFLTNVVAIAAGYYDSVALIDHRSPAMVMQPRNFGTSPGGTAILTASAVGTVPLSYQWQFQGNPIAGATNTWLAITNAQFTDAGEYSVLVSNVLGSVMSSNAVLTVTNLSPTAPSIVQPPSDATVYPGGTAVFTVVASGSLPLSYQWRFQSNNIVGATSASLTLTNVQFSSAGGYSVLVSNTLGSVLSANAILSVVNPPPPGPRITQIHVLGNDISISFTALAGQRYHVQTRDGNISAPWLNRYAITNQIDGILNFLDPGIIATTPARFYRIEAGPQ